MPVGKRKREEVAARRAVVLCLRNESNNLLGPTAIAEELGTTRKAVRGDFEALGINTFSGMDDATVEQHVARHLREGHRALGRGLMESQFAGEGHRLPRTRIDQAMRNLGVLREAPKRIFREPWYQAKGPLDNVHADQNEKLGKWGFKILAAVDGYTCCPLGWQLTSSLRGLEHGRFLNSVVRRWGVPQHIIVDKAPAWRCVRKMMRFYHGDANMSPTPVHLPGGRVILVQRLQMTTSTHNTRIERLWVDCNNVTRKWRREFEMLEGLGLLVGGRHADPLDLFCLIHVYRPTIVAELDKFFRSMQYRRKRQSSRNPNARRGTQRPIDAMRRDGDHSLHVTPRQVDLMDEYITAYHNAVEQEPASPWERDPLTTDAQRAQRARLVHGRMGGPLRERYLAYRTATRHILGLPP